jgi:plastocyanin
VFGSALVSLGATALQAGAVPATGAAVSIKNFAFSPTPLNVGVGTTVTWTNMDAAPHSVTSDTGAFDSSPTNCSPSGTTGCIQPNGTFASTFNTAGTFAYHCRVHSFMHGSIVVGAPAVTVTSTTPASLGQGATKQKLTVMGTGFASGAKVMFSGTGVTAASTKFVSSTALTTMVTVAASVTPGTLNVTVTNSGGGGSGSCTGCFTVVAGPTVTGAAPPSLAHGTMGTVMISGSGYASGAKVMVSGKGVKVTKTMFVDSSHLQVSMTVASTAATGPRTVTVIDPAAAGAGRGSSSTVFSIT